MDYKKKNKFQELSMPKEKKSERYTSRSYSIRNDLLAEFDRIAEDRESGFKGKFINLAIENALEEYKKYSSK